MTLKIVQWNVRSLKHKINEIDSRFTDADILILSETWLSPADNVLIKGYDLVREDRKDKRGGGVAIKSLLKYIIVKPDIKYIDAIEACAIKLFGGDLNIHCLSLGSSYSCPSGSQFESFPIGNLDLVICNDGRQTHVNFNNGSESVFDYTMIQPDPDLQTEWSSMTYVAVGMGDTIENNILYRYVS
ncbi:uncharacterized protein LOC115242153 [Formica exsecta]|uniref:uncharacterized protein LOC115242153 n=1 Tax=Formica exsecta TaxID=72781 RepID=UPI0011438141|nr:uncharacterized protein LOC115242153 [Formica exsecta]